MKRGAVSSSNEPLEDSSSPNEVQHELYPSLDPFEPRTTVAAKRPRRRVSPPLIQEKNVNCNRPVGRPSARRRRVHGPQPSDNGLRVLHAPVATTKVNVGGSMLGLKGSTLRPIPESPDQGWLEHALQREASWIGAAVHDDFSTNEQFFKSYHRHHIIRWLNEIGRAFRAPTVLTDSAVSYLDMQIVNALRKSVLIDGIIMQHFGIIAYLVASKLHDDVTTKDISPGDLMTLAPNLTLAPGELIAEEKQFLVSCNFSIFFRTATEFADEFLERFFKEGRIKGLFAPVTTVEEVGFESFIPATKRWASDYLSLFSREFQNQVKYNHSERGLAASKLALAKWVTRFSSRSSLEEERGHLAATLNALDKLSTHCLAPTVSFDGSLLEVYT